MSLFRTASTKKFEPYIFFLNVTDLLPVYNDKELYAISSILINGGGRIVLLADRNMGPDEVVRIERIWNVNPLDPQFYRRMLRVSGDPVLGLKRSFYTIIRVIQTRQIFYVGTDPNALNLAAALGFQSVSFKSLMDPEVRERISNSRYNIQMVPRANYRYEADYTNSMWQI